MLSKDYKNLEIASGVISELIDKQIALSGLETLPVDDRKKAVHLGKCACEVQTHLLSMRKAMLKQEV